MAATRWYCALAIIIFTTWTGIRAEIIPQAGSKILREISDDLDDAVALISDPTLGGSMLVAERNGHVRAIDTRSGRIREVIDIEALVGAASPRGLMSIAAQGSRSALILVVGYMDPQGDLVVGRFAITDPHQPLDEESMTVIIKIARLAPHRLGSSLAFGPDGALYIATCAGEATNERELKQGTNQAQLPQSLLGKVIRVKLGESAGYSVPVNNPFVKKSPFQPEIYALGFRAPEAIYVTQQSNQIFVLDTNERHNEVNFVEAGKDYGWDILDGSECRRKEQQKDCDASQSIRPLVTLHRTDSNSTLVGGLLYQGDRYPELRESLLFADRGSGTVYAMNEKSPKVWGYRAIAQAPQGAITAIGSGNDGTIYIATDMGKLFSVQ